MLEVCSATKLVPAERKTQVLSDVAVDSSCHATAELLGVYKKAFCCCDLLQQSTTQLQQGTRVR